MNICCGYKQIQLELHREFFEEPEYAQKLGQLNIKMTTQVFTQLMVEEPSIDQRVEYLDRFRVAIREADQSIKYLFKKYCSGDYMIAACQGGYLDTAKEMHANGVDLDIISEGPEYSLLHYAVQEGHNKLASWLIDQRVDLEATDNYSLNTPLLFACYSRNIEIAGKLLRAGANIQVENMSGLTPIKIAFSKVEGELNRAKAVRLGLFLFSMGADPKNCNTTLEDSGFTKFEAKSLNEPFPSEIWRIILRKLPNNYLLGDFRLSCKALSNMAIEVVIEDLIHKTI